MRNLMVENVDAVHFSYTWTASLVTNNNFNRLLVQKWVCVPINGNRGCSVRITWCWWESKAVVWVLGHNAVNIVNTNKFSAHFVRPTYPVHVSKLSLIYHWSSEARTSTPITIYVPGSICIIRFMNQEQMLSPRALGTGLVTMIISLRRAFLSSKPQDWRLLLPDWNLTTMFDIRWIRFRCGG